MTRRQVSTYRSVKNAADQRWLDFIDWCAQTGRKINIGSLTAFNALFPEPKADDLTATGGHPDTDGPSQSHD